MPRTPKFFKVDYIPEARGRKAVREFAMIVGHYASEKGLRLGDLRLQYDGRGEAMIYLHTDEESELENVDGVVMPNKKYRPPEPDEE